MFYTKKIMALILITIAFGTSQAVAQGKWWEKAIDLVTGQDAIQIPNDLSSAEIGDAFKEALRIGSEQVVTKLGATDGFNSDPTIHIPLPDELDRVKSMLDKVGMSGFIDDLELKLNRAAETATPIAKELFLQSIADMKFEDAVAIYQGSNNSATTYFQEQMSLPLNEKMSPIIEDSLLQVGAVKALDDVLGNYKSLPFVPDVTTDLTQHVVDKAMEGIFFYMAKEEAAIRENPARQTTQLLKRVFGVSDN